MAMARLIKKATKNSPLKITDMPWPDGESGIAYETVYLGPTKGSHLSKLLDVINLPEEFQGLTPEEKLKRVEELAAEEKTPTDGMDMESLSKILAEIVVSRLCDERGKKATQQQKNQMLRAGFLEDVALLWVQNPGLETLFPFMATPPGELPGTPSSK